MAIAARTHVLTLAFKMLFCKTDVSAIMMGNSGGTTPAPNDSGFDSNFKLANPEWREYGNVINVIN
jgi:hypothetical protein